MESSRPWKRDIAIFLSSQTISLLGSSLVQYAIMWHITLATRSGAMMTVAIVCGFVPTFLLAPFGGVWADRFDRKRLIAIADGGIALVSLAVAAVYAAGVDALWLLFTASALRAVGAAVHQPAVGAILPQIVPGDRLVRINGINGTIQSTIMLLSPVLSGALLSLFPLQLIFLIDVVTAAAAIAVLLAFLKVGPHRKATEGGNTGYFRDLRLGFVYIRRHRYLVGFFVYVGALLFMISPAAFLTPLQAARSFGGDVWRLSAIEVAFSSGMIAGGLIIAAWGGFRNRVRTMVASNLAMAACTVALGLVPWFWLYLVIMGIFGVALPFYNTPSATLLQEHVEGDYLGRVFSVFTMLSTSLMPLGMLVFGPLADALRIEWILVATGAAMAVNGAVALGSRRLLEAGDPAHARSAAVPGLPDAPDES